jgi:Uma2 family endonuclease
MATTTRLTMDEWLAQPDTKPSSEFVCGEVLQKPMPNLPHTILVGFLVERLHAYARRHSLGLAGPELRCIFGRPNARGYVPDITFISRSRLKVRDAREMAHLQEAPDLTIEVLSPDQHMGRFTEKIQYYLRHGVRLVWVVDPMAETVTVHQPDADSFTLSAGDTLDGGDVLPGFTLSVADIFAELTLDSGDPTA